MNLFWKKLFGGILSTSKYEKNEKSLVRDMKRYDEIGRSAELEEYRQLFHVIKSADFKEKKKILQNRKYKDTEEYRINRKYHKLQNDAKIKLYFDTLHSEQLKQYLQFKTTSEYEDLGDKKKVSQSAHLQKLKNFERSKEYQNYTRFHDSFIIKEYEELKKKTASPEFKKENEFWANEHRWKTVPEYKQEQRYYELAKNPDIVFFENTKPEKFNQHRKLVKSFADNFDWNTLDKSRWSFGFHAGKKDLKEDYSFDNEHQANNGGRNVNVHNGILNIETRHEKVKAAAWNEKKGFIEKDFNYTSDIIQTATEFKQKYGLFRAKVRCTGKIHHAFWLNGNNKLPHINIFHFNGKAITAGNAHSNVMDEVKITGLPHSQYYIYSLIWTPKELIWFINDFEVYRTTSNVPQEPMYLGFNSFIPQKQKPSTGNLYIDWVRVFALEK
ncbi:Glycoside hydrolase family 16 [uncultured Paludibacter sp.]|uniref:Glycoside hydrolase family 16 n=1 Tax=uncultured Paludibacter sp. TaxID=497635 RepID=A0A653AD30_9BACT|nr:Glycoside hydrolase family 16 [uncultured Paludibacter sp.]